MAATRLELTTTGLLYKVAFAEFDLTACPTVAWPKPTEREKVENLCPTFWKFIRNTGLFAYMGACWALVLAVMFLLVLIVILIGSPLAFGIAGYRFSFKKLCAKQEPELLAFVPIAHWPKIWGYRVWPIFVFLAGLAGYQIYLHMPSLWHSFTDTVSMSIGFVCSASYWKITSAICALYLLCVVTYRLLIRHQKSETWMLTKAWLRAKKDRVCPTIVFVPPQK